MLLQLCSELMHNAVLNWLSQQNDEMTPVQESTTDLFVVFFFLRGVHHRMV